MANAANVAASFPIPPPVANLPFGQVQESGLVFLTSAGLQFMQLLWAAIQGSGGVVDQSAAAQPAALTDNSTIRKSIAQSQLLTGNQFDPRQAKAIRDTVLLAARPPIPPRHQTYIAPPVSTFAGLPASPADGARAFITDGSLAAAGNFGAAAAGAGANHVPVYWDGGTSAWRIG